MAATTVEATPQFARAYKVSCNSCHAIVPMLNERGIGFEERGFRGSEAFEERKEDILPLALWITGRYENESSLAGNTYMPKVELISGGPIGESLSYFTEWRVLSLESRGDGTLRDRSGRIEDAYLTWDVTDRFSFEIGQYRSLRQVDVSRRLSISEPSIFGSSLPGEPHSDPRKQSLRAFAPGSRSPGFTFGWQSMEGEAAGDGLFHFATLAFPGEFSIPLNSEARREASFEFEGSPKGVFLETFYRKGYKTLGAHAFLDDNRRMLTGVATTQVGDFHLLGGLGVDDRSNAATRLRSTLQAEYLLPANAFPGDIGQRVRPGFGMRVEHITRSGSDPALIPYFAIAGPNRHHTFLLQIQHRVQPGNNATVIDLSWLF